ncbi:MAG: phosphoribosylformylglycinamidine synthase [Oscillospiraceae bacterium]
MVFRVFVEKKDGLRLEAEALKSDICGLLGIKALESLRILNRYDVEGIDEELFKKSCVSVFSEPQLDDISGELEADGTVFAVEYLPGQFDQRADSAAQCIQIISQGERPLVRTAKVYVLGGDISGDELERIKKYVINPVEAREASMERFETLKANYEIPTQVETLNGFTALEHDGIEEFCAKYGLAMDADDLMFCRDYFRSEGREPTITEIRMIDTYWSDHCRHTTFLTHIDDVAFDDPEAKEEYENYLSMREECGDKKPICLMDIATVGVKYLKKKGLLPKLDESEEINACTVKMKITARGEEQDWLLLFKNETHNHPTEIEPFGGAATCIGGAIRDPLSGRSYVYAAMRVTGAADPTVPVSETIPGKLPQRQLVTGAASGYSSYGNQIGLATGIVDEIYHPGYAAKHMEIGAVIAAAPAENVRREVPAPGDIVILLGGRTGRDGIGGATGSSKAHNAHSVETCGAEVQKGNAPEERKLQRLFRNAAATKLIKRCNDFGAGGVSVAVGELADGLHINLNAVPKKYEGLDGTELAISESQERMAVVVAAQDVDAFRAIADSENLESTVIAVVTEEPRLVMDWNGRSIVNISREFLNTNGAPKHTSVCIAEPECIKKQVIGGFIENIKAMAADLNICSKRGLSERFDSTIGAATLLMPFGGKNQLTPIQAMAHRIPTDSGNTDACSFMAWGYNADMMSKDPFKGAYISVVESVSKLIAAGASFEDVYLTFQEYFCKPGTDPKRWGQPMAALLGSLKAQRELGIASIGGKDSMSGSFEELDVPPTLVSFAVTTGKESEVISNDFKAPGHTVCWLKPEYDRGLPTAQSLKKLYGEVTELIRSGRAAAVYTPTLGGAAEAVFKMAIGNGVGFSFADGVTVGEIFGYAYGSFIVELTGGEPVGTVLGTTTDDEALSFGSDIIDLSELLELYEGRLEKVYPTKAGYTDTTMEFNFTAVTRAAPAVKTAKPRVLIPVFPGTNCEFDTARAFENAGAEAKVFVIRNMTADSIAQSVESFASLVDDSQIVFVPGGFSGGDEPDGSGKFITAFFRNASVGDAVTRLLETRDGLMGGICNGFQALIKLGLVPYGKIIDTDENCPTLTFNTIGRHQSRLVRTRVASNKSPWFAATKPGDIYTVAISHGEGRFLAGGQIVASLADHGQIATQYVDFNGRPTMDIAHNPNGSFCAIEGITSPDGRVFGKMGHTERAGGLYKNVPGNYDMKLFESAVKYFK